ncbi:MAG: dihydroorotase [Bacteroidales bacterium]|nr:dihydroorotase [Bacteroidales bacterium]
MLIKNIHIVDDLQDFVGDVRIKEDKICEVGQNLQPSGDELLDFSQKNYYLLPAFTDLHVHFRDPGLTHKEDVFTGSAAAIAGGYTAVNLMPNTKPCCSTIELVKDVERRVAEVGMIYANQTLSMTKNLEGKDIEALKTLKKDEILFVTDDGKGVQDEALMEEIFNICKEKNITIQCHAEDSRYSATDMRQAENSMTFRDIRLCEMTNGRIHFCHVSTKEAIQAIADAQARGVAVSCEVTPHHLMATGAEVNHYRVNPPFREQDDIDALIKAIQEDVVCAIATDHAPHTTEDKRNGSPGMIGLELAFPLCYTKLVKGGFVSLNKLMQLMSTNPSKMMKLNKGRIVAGCQADLVIADLDHEFTINSAELKSKSHNTPFDGWKVYGKVVNTISKGRIF